MKRVKTKEIVLIVTTKTDITADLVILEFQKRGTRYIRFNTEDFPQKVELSWKLTSNGTEGFLRFPLNNLSLNNVTSVWYRRPAAPQISEVVQTEGVRSFAHRETAEALSGLWRTMECFWMSRPDAINYASYKPRQLKVAQDLGFTVPKTLVSNSPEAVERFQGECGILIAKPIFSGNIEVRGERNVVFATQVDELGLATRESIRLAPALFQEYIDKDIELRVTVIGNQVLAASINSQDIPEGAHDWRKAQSDALSFRSCSLPVWLSRKCVQLVSGFGLTFGAIDLIRTPQGEYVFLELNPNGQWGWLEERTGDPYIATMASVLERGRL